MVLFGIILKSFKEEIFMKKTLALVLAAIMLLATVSFASAEKITNFVDYQTQANEMETFCFQYSQAAVDLNVLSNCIDGLLTNDNKGALVPAAAESYETPDNGKTWIFTVRDGMCWVDYQGNYKADFVAEDFAWGLEWVLNFAKNSSANTSMPIEMIVGAGDYYEYTKSLSEDEAKALGLEKFYEMVGVVVDGNTITFTCVDELPYFPSVACYNCLAPVSGELLAELGAGYLNVSYDTLWYNGPYTITEYEQGNHKVLTKNPLWYGTDEVFDTVTVKMVESAATAYQLFKNGEIDYISLAQGDLNSIYSDPDNEYNKNLVEARPTKYSYQIHLVYDKKTADGEADVNWNTAVANENFRKAIYFGVDFTDFLARTNSINPMSCLNWCYTGNAVAVNSQGVDYTQLVRDEIGLQYEGTYSRYNAELGAQYKAAAMEELAPLGVTFPVSIDYYISGSSETALESAKTLQQIFAKYLGEDFVTLNICTYVSSLAKEVRNPQLASIYINGWGADFADPVNFLGQETYADDNAYYSQSYSKINNATDEALIAAYQEFTAMVNEAKAITGDLDARYAAFAKAEACMLNHALVIPLYYNVSWMLTKVNNYSKVYTAYGSQSERYINWETSTEIYTADEYAAFKSAYEAN